MRLGLISDIHGNLPALETVLDHLRRARVDQLVCLGDVAAFGPQPREALSRLRATGCAVVMGNTDAWLLDPRPHAVRDADSQRVTDIEMWCAVRLTADDLDYVRTFQPTVEVALGGKARALCFHGSPRADTEIIAAATPDDELDRIFAGFSATVMAGGHTHAQMFRRHREMIILNPGSVGLPYERHAQGEEARNPAWAEYALVDWEGGDLAVTLRRAPYDVAPVIRAALESEMPHAEWWTRGWLERS